MKQVSYCLFGGEHYKASNVSGLFQWWRAFETFGKRGNVNATLARDHIEEYDLIHVNFTPGNASYISGIRTAIGPSSSTKIIANVDFAMMMWSRIDPHVMKKELESADFIFHVESMGASRLSEFLGKRVPTIPHPVDTKYIKTFAKPGQMEEPLVIGCQHHRYLNSWAEYYYPTARLRKDGAVRTVLMNTVVEGKPAIPYNAMFDDIVERLNMEDYLRILSKCYLGMDITYDYTYGRSVVEAACLGVPTIASSTIEAGKELYPFFTVTPGNDKLTKCTIEWILENPDMTEKAIAEAYRRADAYSLESSYAKMVGALEDGGIV